MIDEKEIAAKFLLARELAQRSHVSANQPVCDRPSLAHAKTIDQAKSMAPL